MIAVSDIPAPRGVSCKTSKAAILSFVVFGFKALLIFSLSLLVGCSKTSAEPKIEEPMLTPIEYLGFSHYVEEDGGEWNGLEKVYAKITAQYFAGDSQTNFLYFG